MFAIILRVVIVLEPKEHTCCFFGHRKIEVTDNLVSRLKEIVEDLIVRKNEKGIENNKCYLSF